MSRVRFQLGSTIADFITAGVASDSLTQYVVATVNNETGILPATQAHRLSFNQPQSQVYGCEQIKLNVQGSVNHVVEQYTLAV